MDSLPQCLVLSTCPPGEDAARIADTLVERGLAACVNVLPGVRSLYVWQGKKEEADEQLLIIKTRRDVFSALEAALRELHPYELPEIVMVPVVAGSADYLRWIDEAVTP